MGKPGPETKLIAKMRKAGAEAYGDRLVVIKQHGGQFSEVGVSDLLCVLDGVFIAAEVKAPESYGNSVQRAVETGATIKQQLFLRKVIKADGVGGVVADVPGFMALLMQAELRVWT